MYRLYKYWTGGVICVLGVLSGLVCCMYWTKVLYELDWHCTGLVYTGMLYVLDWAGL